MRTAGGRILGALLAGLLGGSGCYVGARGASDGASGTDDGGLDDVGDEGDGGSGDADDDDSGDDGASAACQDVDPGAALTRRLTRDQLVYTIGDVLGVDVATEAEALPADLHEAGFTNTAAALVASFAHVQGYRDLAAATVDKIPDFPGFVAGYSGCTEFGDACEVPFVADLGRRLFRRPLTATEVATMRTPFRVVEEEGDGFEMGAQLVVTSMLQAPQFLYRIEGQTGGASPRALDSYELASRLSYLLWSSAPDDALLDAAEAATLLDPDTLVAEAERLLDDDRARRVSQRYARDWLALDRLLSASRDDTLYPEFTPALAEAMAAETLAVYDATVWEEDAPLWSLLTRDTTLASASVAELYGFPAAGAGVAEYELTDAPNRMGILTHPAVIAAMSDRDEPSLVERALFVYRDVLCGEMGPPPPDVDQSMFEAEVGVSQRDLSLMRRADPACGACHNQFDGLSYALMQFDAIGRHRTVDEQGNALQSDGVFEDPFAPDDPKPFDDAVEFVEALSESPAVKTCIARKHLQFTIGRPLEPADACAVDRVTTAFVEGGGTWRSLALAIISDPTFLVIEAE
ncbi:MAG: DUF1592 domain-containing protein [Myxococcota bacterium]